MIRRQMSTRRVAQDLVASHKTGFTALAAATLVAIMPISTAVAGSRSATQAQPQYTEQAPVRSPSAPAQTEQYQQGTEQYQQGTEQYQQGTEQYRSPEQATEQYRSSGKTEEQYSYGSEQYKTEKTEKSMTYSSYPSTWLNDPSKSYRVRLSAEMGTFAVLSHTLQLGRNGTRLDLRRDAGQTLMFPFVRLESNIAVLHNNFTLVYQPLQMSTRVVLGRNVVVDGLTIPRGTALDVNTSFPFVRASYLYDFASTAGDELSLGASLQVRNAEIDLTSASGTLRATRRLTTVMPSLKFRARKSYSSGAFLAADADAFFASIPFLNGTLTSHVRGLTVDAAIKAGVRLRHGVEPFLSLRYIGGANDGTLPTTSFGTGGFSSDWVHVLALSMGVNLL